jgi:hypothetical protein
MFLYYQARQMRRLLKVRFHNHIFADKLNHKCDFKRLLQNNLIGYELLTGKTVRRFFERRVCQ